MAIYIRYCTRSVEDHVDHRSKQWQIEIHFRVCYKLDDGVIDSCTMRHKFAKDNLFFSCDVFADYFCIAPITRNT